MLSLRTGGLTCLVLWALAGAARDACAQDADASKTIDVKCPACAGGGVLTEIGCTRCRSRGYIGVDECPQCKTKGTMPYPCAYCKGQGSILTGGGAKECKGCKGKKHPPCLLCRGKGTIRRLNPAALGFPTKECFSCGGTGFECQAECTICRGDGKVSLRRGGSPLMAGEPNTGDDDRNTSFRDVKCTICDGKGKGRPVCSRCQGRGYGGSDRAPVPCTTCYGTGHQFEACKTCRGLGVVKADN